LGKREKGTILSIDLKKLMGFKFKFYITFVSSKMNTESIMHLLNAAKSEEIDEKRLIHDILPYLCQYLLYYLKNQKNSHLSKLNLILQIYPKLKQFLEESALLKKVLVKCGDISIIVVIFREIHFFASQIDQSAQSAYETALLEFSSSGFPENLADLPKFLAVNLIDRYETLKKEASKAAAAAEEAKLESARQEFREMFATCWLG